MKKLERSDIQNLYEYEKARPDFRNAVMALKRHRRIGVGRHISLVFENRETLKFQIQEMIRAERLVDDAKIDEEIRVYNQLIPDAHELSATLLLEITEPGEIKPALDRFQGIDSGDRVYFEFGEGDRVPAQFEAGHSREDRISAVQYVRFAFTARQQEGFKDPKTSVALVVDHPGFEARTVLTPEQRAALRRDFEETSAGVGGTAAP
ncbi:MAG: DUF3501 family protein [Acidobacteriia bacterium]|nr:DUF3501 family protein [Terriglobia bacterium]